MMTPRIVVVAESSVSVDHGKPLRQLEYNRNGSRLHLGLGAERGVIVLSIATSLIGVNFWSIPRTSRLSPLCDLIIEN